MSNERQRLALKITQMIVELPIPTEKKEELIMAVVGYAIAITTEVQNEATN